MLASKSTHVVVKCKACNSEFEISRKDLARTAKENEGYVPCYFCHSRSTEWDLNQKEDTRG